MIKNNGDGINGITDLAVNLTSNRKNSFNYIDNLTEKCKCLPFNIKQGEKTEQVKETFKPPKTSETKSESCALSIAPFKCAL